MSSFTYVEPSCIRVYGLAGYGSVNTKIRRFTGVISSVGSDITYTDSATLGGSFTINSSGIYAISYTDSFSAAADFGVSKNSNELTTSLPSITRYTDMITFATTSSASTRAFCGVTLYLEAGDIIRAHTNGQTAGAQVNDTRFTITRIK